jgi:hypothetical protein
MLAIVFNTTKSVDRINCVTVDSSSINVDFDLLKTMLGAIVVID